jgi:hypothetical protein
MKYIFYILFFTLVIFGYSQQKIPLQHVDYNEVFYVLENNKVKPKHELQYFWFKSKEVHQSFGACEGKPLDGEYKSFYKSQQLRSKGEFEKGLKDGDWTYWDEKGQITKQEQYKNGLLHGEVSEFVEDSLVKSKFKSGELVLEESKDKPKELEVVEMSETTDKEEEPSLWSRIFSKDKSEKVKKEKESAKKEEE